MARTQKFAITFPAPDSKHTAPREDSDPHGSYLEYILDLADRLLKRPIDEDGSQAA